jgi:endo-alpha-1,4-polygalactosaminidase (GH114 family)
METKRMAKQMITFQRSLFENSYHAMNMVVDQTENMAKSLMDQLPMVPQENKKAMEDALGFYKKAREDFKKAVEDGFAKMEELFAAKEE